MAKFEGILRIEGTMQGMTFYKSKDGALVRTKGGVSRERILKDANFQRTRENGSEFGHCAKMAKLFRKSIADKVNLAKDHRTSSRLNQVMHRIKALDEVSDRGERSVAEGILTPGGPQELNGFEFNLNSRIEQVFLQLQALDTTTGTLEYPDFLPGKHLLFPSGATEADLQLIATEVNFTTGTSAVQESAKVTVENTGLPFNLALSIPIFRQGMILSIFYCLRSITRS